MSLSGTLDELALAELMQMAALASKSGLLQIEAGGVTVRLGFERGMVMRVARSDGSLDRKQILEDAGLAPDSVGEEVEKRLQESAIDSLLEVMTWTEGRFEFDMVDDPGETWSGPDGVELPCSVSPQFLALEGARLDDESSSAGMPASPAPEPTASVLRATGTLIVIDRDLGLLEGIKQGLADSGIYVHIFQSAEDGLARFKQYLLRGEIPALVLGEGVFDPVEPRRRPGSVALAKRVRSLAPAVGVVHLSWEATAPAGPIDIVLAPPDRREPMDESTADFVERLRRVLGCTPQPDAAGA